MGITGGTCTQFLSLSLSGSPSCTSQQHFQWQLCGTKSHLKTSHLQNRPKVVQFFGISRKTVATVVAVVLKDFESGDIVGLSSDVAYWIFVSQGSEKHH